MTDKAFRPNWKLIYQQVGGARAWSTPPSLVCPFTTAGKGKEIGFTAHPELVNAPRSHSTTPSPATLHPTANRPQSAAAIDAALITICTSVGAAAWIFGQSSRPRVHLVRGWGYVPARGFPRLSL